MSASILRVTFLLTFVFPSAAATHAVHHFMTGSAAKDAASSKLQVAADLDQRLAKFRVVRMPFHFAKLSLRERKLVTKLVEACQWLERIYWRQSDPEGLAMYQSLASSSHTQDRKLRRYLRINGSRFDLVDENRPFVGTEALPPGRALYPKGLTQAKIDAFLKDHPEKKAEIYNPLTVVRWHGDTLEGLPYHIAFRAFLEPAAKALREAAALSNDPAFAKFLRLRATALLSDDYFESDLAWLDLKNPKFDIIFAPYETYLDGLLGVKGSYGAAVMIRNEEQSKKLALFQKYESDIQDALPLAPEDRPSKRGFETPMEVMDTPFRAGDLRHGYQAVADNLPNDPRIHQKKGSKKLFFKNFMDARVNYVILPVAKKLMRADQSAKASADGYMLATIMHEVCHGLGPVFSRTPQGPKDIREAIGPVFGGLEEAKADVVGLYGLHWLVEHDALPKARLEEYYASYLAGIFRTVRFGTGEAHGRAEMMEFNFLSERGAIQRDASGRYAVNFAKIPEAIAELARELLEIEATGDRDRAEKWFAKYGAMPTELQTALKSASDVPVDIDPVSSFPEPMR
jgi:hypothetical protein